MASYLAQVTEAAKNKASFSSHSPSSSSSSQSSPRPQTTAGTNGGCINYDPPTRTITISCSTPTKLTDIDNKLHDMGVLAKQSTPTSGVWFLNANLVIAKGATFHIDSTDTKWLKISSK